jgi:3-phenylpropionate/trans-cinnamate dioxygenase ferredoxin component
VTEFVRVGSLAEIPEGELRAYEVPTGRVAVAHDERRIFAFADECPYGGCSLSEGTFDDRLARVTCPRDESVFDAETGEPVDGPARDPLPIYLARIVEGWVEVAAAPGLPE